MNTKSKILDIAMNLTRIGNWAADGFRIKQKRIKIFLNQTSEYLKSFEASNLKEPFKTTFIKFLQDFQNLEKEAKSGPRDEIFWAEKMMTWGNILTHRAKLLD